MGEIRCKRVYEAPDDGDGCRVLVDRLWPRGLRKDAACLDLWAKQVAPTTGLRRWFGHDPERLEEFAIRYAAELDASQEAEVFALQVADQLVRGDVTLLYAARDPHCNHALVLRRWLEERLACGTQE